MKFSLNNVLMLAGVTLLSMFAVNTLIAQSTTARQLFLTGGVRVA